MNSIIIPDGSLIWRLGNQLGIIPPDANGDYLKENAQYGDSNNIPTNIIFPKGKGSFKNSFQFYGTPPEKDFIIELEDGWAKTKIEYTNKVLNISTTGGTSAINHRWEMETQRKQEILSMLGANNNDGVINYLLNTNKKKLPKNITINYNQQRQPNPTYIIPQIIPVTQPNKTSIDINNIPNLENKPLNQDNVNDLESQVREQKAKDQATWEWLRSEIYIRDKGICWICHEFVLLRDYHLGHIVDRTNNGSDSLSNCTVMHKNCNVSKPRHKSIEEASKWRLMPKQVKGISSQDMFQNHGISF